MDIEPLDDADEWAAADTFSERCMLTMDDMYNINGYEQLKFVVLIGSVPRGTKRNQSLRGAQRRGNLKINRKYIVQCCIVIVIPKERSDCGNLLR